MNCNLTHSYFSNAEEACKYLESLRWADGVVCPFDQLMKAVLKVPPIKKKTNKKLKEGRVNIPPSFSFEIPSTGQVCTFYIA